MKNNFPNIEGTFVTGHSLGLFFDIASNVSGGFSFYGDKKLSSPGTSGASYYDGLHFDANKSNGIYGNSVTVQPHSYRTLFIIKF